MKMPIGKKKVPPKKKRGNGVDWEAVTAEVMACFMPVFDPHVAEDNPIVALACGMMAGHFVKKLKKECKTTEECMAAIEKHRPLFRAMASKGDDERLNDYLRGLYTDKK